MRSDKILVGALSAAGLWTAVAPPASAAPTEDTPAQSSPFTDASTPVGHQADAIFDRVILRNGQTLTQVRLHYATLGSPHRNARGEIDNAVLLLHWTGASGASLLAPNFAEALYGPGRPLDARRYFLIFPDNLGHGQSSKPSDGLHARFPNYRYDDLVELQHRLVTETLGVRRLHAIIGLSMGGMNAWQWAVRYPGDIDGILPIVAFPSKVAGRNLLWRRMVIDEIRSDPEWRGGDYTAAPRSWLKGYEILRMMIDGVPHLQATIRNRTAAEDFLKQVTKQAETADANDTLYSLEASEDYDPEPALSSVRSKVFALNFSDDEFNPDELGILQRLIQRVPRGRYVVQSGAEASFGHLTMAHPELWADQVATFMSWLEEGDKPPTETRAR